MSKLKAYIGPAPDEKGLADYYLKSEADKVIAEKDKEIAELKEQVHDYAQGLYVMQARAEKEARHHKHKRCLDNAWWCRRSSNAYAWSASNLRGWKIAVYYDKKAELYRRWCKIWLELAAEPTWAKFLQLIHKEEK